MIDILSIFIQTVWEVVKGCVSAIYNIFSSTQPLRDIITFLSPMGTVLILLGIPLVLVPTCISFLKLVRKKD